MQKSILVAAMALSLAGCMPSLSTTSSRSAVLKGHVMAFDVDANGNAVSVRDRSGKANEAVVTTHFVADEAKTVDISVNGQLLNGSAVPARSGLKVDGKISNSFVAAAAGPDSFLGLASVKGTNFAVGAYGVTEGGTTYFGLGATGNRTTDVPATGSARYTGAMAATVAGSASGFQSVVGTVKMDASFGPGQGSISGRVSNLTAVPGGTVDYDILMEPTAIVGSAYENGRLRLVAPGSSTSVATMASSDYQGALYGAGAGETAGTFQFAADGAPAIVGTGTESIQGIGVFGGSK
ncbi:MAG: hypothetical protein KF849_18550 [Rhizobiaceae bacterium]|nr:hypothetical protein [Rhizobiaceae bacterium]